MKTPGADGAGGQLGGPDSGAGGEVADAARDDIGADDARDDVAADAARDDIGTDAARDDVAADDARDDVAADALVSEPPLTGIPIASFDTTVNAFVLDTYHEVVASNLGDPMSGLAMLATLSFDASLGSPTAGSLRVDAPFSGANQYFSVLAPSFASDSRPNWQGAKMHVRARADGGEFHGVIQPFVYTTGVYLFGGTALLFTGNGAWQEVTLDVSNAMTREAGYSPLQVIDFGVQFSSGFTGAGQGAVTIHIDSFTIELAPDAGR